MLSARHSVRAFVVVVDDVVVWLVGWFCFCVFIESNEAGTSRDPFLDIKLTIGILLFVFASIFMMGYESATGSFRRTSLVPCMAYSLFQYTYSIVAMAIR